MNIVILDAHSTADFDPDFSYGRQWPEELHAAVEEADVVLGTFSPHAVRILKGPEGLTVTEFRMGRTKSKDEDGAAIEQRAGILRLEGSRDEDECAAQNARLRSDSREGWIDQGVIG